MTSSSDKLIAVTNPRALLLGCALLALSVVAVFGRVVEFPFIAFDDAELIVRNPLVHSADVAFADQLITPTVGYVVPVTIALERALFAFSNGAPWSFHAMALALHALCVCLVYAFCLRLGARALPAFAAVALFAMHPLVVQPVAWAICLKDLLMACFAFGAVHAFWTALHAAPQTEQGEASSDRVALVSAVVAVLLALLSMLSKPTATLLGMVFVAAVFVRHREPAFVPRSTRLAALLTAGGGVLIGFISRIAHDAHMGVERVAGWTPWFPLSVLGRHVAHVVAPGNLLVLYPEPPGTPDVYAWLGVACVLAWLGLIFVARRSSGSVLLLALVAALYLPVSNLLPFGRVMSDSYLYVPLAALSALLALQIDRLASSMTRFVPRARVVLVASLLALSLVLALSSYRQLPRYRGGDALWGPVVRAYPGLYRAHKLYADELLLRGDPERAAKRFVHAFSLDYDPNDLLELGSLLSIAGRIADAECVLIEATLLGTKPGYAAFNYAVLLAFNARYATAYPAIAKTLLTDVERLRRAGKLAFPPPIVTGLHARLTELGSIEASMPPWPMRNCPVLKRPR